LFQVRSGEASAGAIDDRVSASSLLTRNNPNALGAAVDVALLRARHQRCALGKARIVGGTA